MSSSGLTAFLVDLAPRYTAKVLRVTSTEACRLWLSEFLQQENKVLDPALISENPKPARDAALSPRRKVISTPWPIVSELRNCTDIESSAPLNEYLLPRRAVSNVLLQLVHD